ncbi:MAG TPA: AAA family ATPase [Blastocatellia bacterium]|nr:AAA family ATPase [Blastocatellia bacterium]
MTDDYQQEDSRRLRIVGGTPATGDEQLRQWLVSHMERNPHLTTAVLSRKEHIGMSRPSLEAFIKGIYYLPKTSGGQGVNPLRSKLEPSIRSYRERVEGPQTTGYAQSFIEDRAWLQFQTACKVAIESNLIVIIYGTPGIGKTRCMREYSVRKMTTAPVMIMCSPNVTLRHFVQEIAVAVGADHKRPVAQLEQLIIKKLRSAPRPIFVDQANYLNDKSLGTVCYIWELARVPIVLAGTKDLYELFTSSQLQQDVRAQLSSRVAMQFALEALTTEEASLIIKKALPDLTAEEVAAMIQGTGANFRSLDFSIPGVIRAKEKYKQQLESGEMKMIQIINWVCSKLIA